MDHTHVSMEDASALLLAVSRINISQSDMSTRRSATLLALAEIVGIDGGIWAWGRGWPDSSAVVPVAQINFGLDERQLRTIMGLGLDAELDQEFRLPIRHQMGSSTHITSIREDLFPLDDPHGDPAMKRLLRQGGWGCWLHSVRYSDRDTWSNFFFVRNDGRARFGPREKNLVHLALASIPWLHSSAEETLPLEMTDGLTARRRAVMLMLLDGMSRKEIATSLRITEDTVGDHIKAIYAHFGVSGATQLAALFLRNR
jgi:DNA-binding CsgD family transcriptional regulator